jgi:hypothetical protein
VFSGGFARVVGVWKIQWKRATDGAKSPSHQQILLTQKKANLLAPKFSAQAIQKQTDWLVFPRLSGPVCARATFKRI